MVNICLNNKPLMSLPKVTLNIEDKVMRFNHGTLDIVFTPDTAGEFVESDVIHARALGIDTSNLIECIKQGKVSQNDLFVDD